jgi:hypothetical protein
MQVRFAVLLAATLAASLPAGPVAAQEGTPEQQAACRGDTRRFCRKVDPDQGTHGILNCLRQNRAKLSKTCRNLLESHGQ